MKNAQILTTMACMMDKALETAGDRKRQTVHREYKSIVNELNAELEVRRPFLTDNERLRKDHLWTTFMAGLNDCYDRRSEEAQIAFIFVG